MIEVNHLTKRYGNICAVSDLSFTIEKGQIYGFLWPNGAGKSTTMNIMTGCLAATAGEVRIEGVDDAILIPVDALNQTSSGAYVYTSYDEETQQYGGRVNVITGLSNNNYVEIKSGLNVGDTIYYTEEQTFGNLFGDRGGMGNMPGGNGDFGGNMPNMGGEMPDSGDSNRPGSGSDRSDRGSGSRPNGG